MSFKRFTVAILCALLSLASAQNIRGTAAAAANANGLGLCLPQDREAVICSLVVAPVCGYRPDIVCSANDPITCNYVTYSNACEACRDPSVFSYTSGACPESSSTH